MVFKQFRSQFRLRHVPHQEGKAILEVTGLTARYNDKPALENVSFCLEVGERVAVVGPNGAGKSTLFKIVAGVFKASKGEVNIYGSQPEEHICISYVPQRSQVDWTFPVTVADVVMMGRIGKIGLLRWPNKLDWEKVGESLELVGMENLSKRQIGELSGGQQQRVFIAQALAQEADLILMDEPMSGLDTPSQETIFEILDELQVRMVTVMLATHDLNLADEEFDRVMLLNHRLIGFGSAKEVFTQDKLVEAYGGHLHIVQSEEGQTLILEHPWHDEAIQDERDKIG